MPDHSFVCRPTIADSVRKTFNLDLILGTIHDDRRRACGSAAQENKTEEKTKRGVPAPAKFLVATKNVSLVCLVYPTGQEKSLVVALTSEPEWKPPDQRDERVRLQQNNFRPQNQTPLESRPSLQSAQPPLTGLRSAAATGKRRYMAPVTTQNGEVRTPLGGGVVNGSRLCPPALVPLVEDERPSEVAWLPEISHGPA